MRAIPDPIVPTPPATARWELLALLAAVAACLLPFLNKPVHLDDPVYLWVAQQIQRRWWDFYGGTINWYGTPMRTSAFQMNPPLVSFYLAGAAWLLGWAAPALHAAMLIPTLVATAGVYRLARGYVRRPALATAGAVLSPVFLVSASTLMSDMLMLCLWVWAVVLWLEGLRCGSQARLAGGGVLVLLAMLTKYFAIALIPLLALGALLQWRRFRLGLLWLLLPLIGALAYQAYTAHLYGSGMLGSAMGYATARRGHAGGSGRLRLLTGCSFVGGCLLTLIPQGVAATWRRLCCRSPAASRARVAAFTAAAGGILVFFLQLPSVNRLTPLTPGLLLQLALFFAAGLLILMLCSTVAFDERDARSLLLACWLLGTFVFVVALNWTVSARTILPMAPPAALLCTRAWERTVPKVPRQARWRWLPWIGVIAATAVSLAVLQADAGFAWAGRLAAQTVRDRTAGTGRVVYFQGHWGFQYYMQQWGAKPLDIAATRCLPGQLLVVPSINTNLVPVPAAAVRMIDLIQPVESSWIAVLDPARGAGFYSDESGPLPFSFGRAPGPTFAVDEVLHPIQYRPATSRPASPVP